MTRFAGALGVLLATLLGLLVGTPPALAVVPTTTVQWYAYDSPNRTSQTNDITPERSLPAKSHACAATPVAGDHASDGGARADALVAYGYTASDAHAVTAHGDNAAGTTSRLVQVIDGESSALARAGVAANAGRGALNWSRATITQGGVSAVERHLARFESGPGETAMLERLRAISRGELDPTDYDLRFYTHELRESVLYRKAGYPSGQPAGSDAAYDLWDRLHTQALTDYGLTRSGAPMDLFHPSVRP